MTKKKSCKMLKIENFPKFYYENLCIYNLFFSFFYFTSEIFKVEIKLIKLIIFILISVLVFNRTVYRTLCIDFTCVMIINQT